MSDDGKYFRGNRNLFSPNATHNYTEWEIQEVAKCREDPIYFIKNYVKIVHLDRGLVPFALYPYQEKMVDSFHNNRNTICLSTRQSGKSTTCGGYYLWCLLFVKRSSIAILANKELIAVELLSRIKESLEHLPDFLKPKVESFQTTSFKLTNGSKIIAAATSPNAIRGMSISILHIDEFAFIAPNIADEFFASVWPTISSGEKTKTIIVSTPNGYNSFHEMWSKAEKGENSFNPIRVDWHEVPGRDEKWKESIIADLGQQRFDQEYGNNFLGSSRTLISADSIKRLSECTILPVSYTPTTKIFEHPRKGRHYLSVVDVAEGLGKDFSAFTVFDVTEWPIKVVATYRDNTVSPLMYPTVISNMGLKYNNAAVLIEKNSIGAKVAYILQHELEYPNLVSFNFHSSEVGVKTTVRVKRLGCEMLKDLIENNKLEVNDVSIVNEISTFILHKNSYRADEGRNDDLVMTLVLLGWFTQTDEFKYITDVDLRREMLKLHEEQLESEILPAGFFAASVNDDLDRYFIMQELAKEGFF